jgi:glycosyltransferase involved in cell wall biosynthesis
MDNKIITISTMANGGIKSVVENYEKTNLFNDFEHEWLCSHIEGSLLTRIYIFLKCLFFLSIALIKGGSLFHIHMAMKGSFFRKMILVSFIKTFNRKVILHLHGSEFEVFYNNRNSFIKRRIKNTFLKADVVIVLSESWKKFIQSVSNTINVIVVPNFVEPIPKQIRTELTNEITFIFLGALGKRKGIYDLLPAFKELLIEQPNAKLIVCGDGELEQVKELASTLGINNSVKFPGWVNGEEKTKLLNKADIIVLPSYNEGLPMVILEAMSLGKCVISTFVGGIPEAINSHENGILIEAGDIRNLTSAMKYACGKDERERLGVAGLATYNKYFSPSIIIPKIHSIYRSLYEK